MKILKNVFSFIFKKEFISKRIFILIWIIAIIIGSGVYYMYDKKQDKLDAEFEKSRAGIQGMIDAVNNQNKNN